jgi:hypothetical protein
VIVFDPAEVDEHPFLVGEQEYLHNSEVGCLRPAFEVDKILRKTEFEGETWFEVLFKDGDFQLLKEADLIGCDIDKLLPKPKRKPSYYREGRRKRKNAKAKEEQPAQLGQPQQAAVREEPSLAGDEQIAGDNDREVAGAAAGAAGAGSG